MKIDVLTEMGPSDVVVAWEYVGVRIAPSCGFIEHAREKQSRELRQLFLPNRNLT